MPQRRRADPRGDLRRRRCLDYDAMQMPGADQLRRLFIRERPALFVHHDLLAPNLPPLAQQG
jgi:hypothetical protein